MAAGPAFAQEALRGLCGDRPGLGTSTCIVDAGHVQVETGLAWSRTDSADEREDLFLAGDTLVRLGLDERTEAQLGFTALGLVRTRDLTTNSVSEDASIGDFSVALRRSLLSPNGSGTSAAVQAYVSLPTGGSAIGGSDWSAGLLLPVGFELGEMLSLAFTPQASLEPDSAGHGHHIVLGGVAGFGIVLTDQLSASAELAAFRDDDPADPAAEALAGLSVAWQSSHDLQLDAGANIGLDADAADLELYFGLVRRF